MSSSKIQRKAFWLAILIIVGLLLPWQQSYAVDGPVAWTPKGPFGGSVRAIAIDPGNPDIIYAGASGGVYRSEDGGEHWQLASRNFTKPIRSLAVNPDHPNEVYAGTDQSGLFKSENRGRTWQHVNIEQHSSPTITALTITPRPAPNGPTRIYAGTKSRLYRSLNRGVTWQRLRDFYSVNAVAVHPQKWWVLYVGTDSGLYKSFDNGDHWAKTDAGIPEELDIQSLVIDPETPGTIYAGTYGGGVYKSIDAGVSWTASNQGMETGFVWALAIDPQTPTTLYAGTNQGVFKSEDGGASWRLTTQGKVAALAISSQEHQQVFAGLRRQGVMKSEDAGVTWAASNQGLTNLGVSVMLPSPVEAGSFLVGSNHLWLWNRSQNTWRKTTYPDSVTALVQQADAPQTIIAASNNHVYKSEDGGVTWREMSTLGIIKVLVNHPQDANTFYVGTWGAVYKSSDGGETWQQTALTGVVVGDILVDPVDPQVVYVGTWTGDKMYKSEDGGDSWQVINQGITRSGVWALAMDPDDSQTLFAGAPGQLFKSENGGESWRMVGQDTLPFTYFNALTFDARSPKTLYAATYSGLFQSTDGGERWQRLGLGAGQELRSVLPDPNDRSAIYAGTAANGLYEGKVLRQRLHLPLLLH